MPISAPGICSAAALRRRQAAPKGFTLIEVLVVLLILGVAVSGASLGLDAIHRRDTDLAVRRLQMVLEATAERARTLGQSIEFEILPDGYRFNMLDTDGRWVPFNEAPLFVERELPPAVRWRALVQPSAEAGRIKFGSFSPRFELVVDTPDGAVRLLGQVTGAVVLQEIERLAR